MFVVASEGTHLARCTAKVLAALGMTAFNIPRFESSGGVAGYSKSDARDAAGPGVAVR